MMLMGEGVGSKYKVIIDGRRAELMANVSDPVVREQRIDELNEFRTEVQHGLRKDFEELFELYNSARI